MYAHIQVRAGIYILTKTSEKNHRRTYTHMSIHTKELISLWFGVNSTSKATSVVNVHS